MDGERFDALIRAWGARRGVLRLLAGAALAGMRAQHAPEEAAAACRRRNQQCSQRRGRRCCSGQGLACIRGRCRPSQCSRFRPCRAGVCCGGACQACCDDGDCPGGLVCRGGDCVCYGLTRACAAREECCLRSSDIDCARVATNKGGNFGCGFLRDADRRCCLRERAARTCSHDCECCGDLICANGACRCRPPFEHCRRASECCATGDGRQTCAVVVQKVDGQDACLVDVNDPDPRFCCQPEGATCRNLCDCCGDQLCRDGVCVPPPGPCVPFGGACARSDQCCNGVPCSGGLCRFN